MNSQRNEVEEYKKQVISQLKTEYKKLLKEYEKLNANNDELIKKIDDEFNSLDLEKVGFSIDKGSKDKLDQLVEEFNKSRGSVYTDTNTKIKHEYESHEAALKRIAHIAKLIEPYKDILSKIEDAQTPNQIQLQVSNFQNIVGPCNLEIRLTKDDLKDIFVNFDTTLSTPAAKA